MSAEQAAAMGEGLRDATHGTGVRRACVLVPGVLTGSGFAVLTLRRQRLAPGAEESPPDD